MDAYKIYKEILCIDLKGFFASVECALRGLDPFKTPLIVADESRGGGSVVLAVTPYLKAQGIKSRCRLHDIKDTSKMIVAPPRMRAYLKASKEVVRIYLKYVAYEDLHVYSIDEAFLDLTSYLSYYDTDIKTLAKRILTDILKTTQLPATCGIGDNLLLSKLALDLYSKHHPDGIAVMRYDDVQTNLWPLKPLSAMWGIGPRMERRLNQLGIDTIGALATFDVDRLKRLFGVIGEELYYHANGIDMSIISEKSDGYRGVKTVGLGQTLFKDYDDQMIQQILLEMCDEVAEKLRFINKVAKTIHLGIHYSKHTGGGFSKQAAFEHPTDDTDTLLNTVLTLFFKHSDGLPIRRVFIRASNLTAARDTIQVSLFDDVVKKQKRLALWKTIDSIRAQYGKTRALRLSSYQDDSTLIKRSGLVGGHHE